MSKRELFDHQIASGSNFLDYYDKKYNQIVSSTNFFRKQEAAPSTAHFSTTSVDFKPINMDNLDKISTITKIIFRILERLVKIGDDIMDKLNDKYSTFYENINTSAVILARLKKINSYKSETFKKIKDITQVIWDDYADFMDIVKILLVDFSQYKAFNKEAQIYVINSRRYEYSSEFMKYQNFVLEKSHRKVTTEKNRIEKNLKKFNKYVLLFKNLDSHLNNNTIAFKSLCKEKDIKGICNITINSNTVCKEFDHLINDYIEDCK